MARGDGSWLVDGSAPMEEVAAQLRSGVPEDEAGAYHTLAGFVMARLGHIPHAADAFEWGGLRFEVVDMDGRRVDKVMVQRVPGAGNQEPGADETSAASWESGVRGPGTANGQAGNSTRDSRDSGVRRMRLRESAIRRRRAGSK